MKINKILKKILPAILVVLVIVVGIVFFSDTDLGKENEKAHPWWEVQSIDTMKYSRDAAREMMSDPESDKTISMQIENIAKTGATHVAIATPYDSEFVPILTRWVTAARKNNLKVWFRGNFSGWEGWFGYKSMTRADHIAKLAPFIENNPTLFEDGDIFTSCPECENGGAGDPRHTGDASGFREFLVEEYNIAKKSFQKIEKNVSANYFSMNGDVAQLIMNERTTADLDGIIVIDHYVGTPEKLANDIVKIAKKSRGKVVLGEFGAPIPDIHGNLTEEQQAEWLSEALERLALLPELHGLNYWVSVGGSTELWDYNGKPRKAVSVLTNYYTPRVHEVKILNAVNRPITNASISISNKKYMVDQNGVASFASIETIHNGVIEAPGYKSQEVTITGSPETIVFSLEKEHEGFLFQMTKLIYSIKLRFNLR